MVFELSSSHNELYICQNLV